MSEGYLLLSLPNHPRKVNNCHVLEKDLIPNFVKFRTANSRLRNTESYDACQKLLLNQELNNKRDKWDKDTRGFKDLKRELGNILSSIDFLYITSLFLEKNAKTLEKIKSAQNVKLSKLMEDNPKHNVKDLIFNFSSHVLTESQESILI